LLGLLWKRVTRGKYREYQNLSCLWGSSSKNIFADLPHKEYLLGIEAKILEAYKDHNKSAKDVGEELGIIGSAVVDILSKYMDREEIVKRGRKISGSKVKGENHHNFGKSIAHPSKFCYPFTDRLNRSFTFRSSWEVAYARYLDRMKFHWDYEPSRFAYYTTDGNKHTYCPDFLVDELGGYVEIKGLMTDIDQYKIDQFRKNNSNLKLTVLRKDDLTQLGVFS
jgi:hypothetical protein